MGAPLRGIRIYIFGFLRMSRKKILMIPLPKLVPFLENGHALFLHRGEWGSKNLLSDIITKSLVVITHSKTRKSAKPIFCNLSLNMQMRHYLIPDVLLILLHLST